ncbi:MAG TPA: bifunctional (p)ppGpp synthetase/guanosine-3',5'-bis(diphosphate) 3'-pyrophosphohydrolase [Actinomycetota bacterium]|nr:bifunctional (p)ppGpp synthetase/guanosine-3',5'-bis(diphosphate) 3'-pyrophosphohydrolase [Actinomycetota bacterium]
MDPKPQGVKGVFYRFRPQSSPPPIPKAILDIVRMVKEQHPKADTRGVVRAYEIAHLVHEGQKRKSGEEFIQHPVGVARILAEQGMDATTIIAAFLHDSVEDTSLELQELRTIFGDEVADIIDGLTKIDRIKFRSKEQERAENLRKMIVAMAKDMRVLIIKLADRLHNMRTIAPLAPDRREIMATETLEIYSPLANRLGMAEVRAELEDLAFHTLQPKVYEEIESLVSKRAPAREQYLEDVITQVADKMREVRIKADISGRPKTLYSIYDKMTNRGREFDEIFDLVGVRVLVDDLKDCYGAVGAIHSLWKPIPGRFKDYIAMPKFNLYQSLHTTVVGPEGKPLEIQIRTHAMHRTAEKGVAAHWAYKEDAGGRRSEGQAAWMKRMLELQDTEDDVEFLDTLRLDLFADEVFVFTPKGEVIELPKGATSIDFAYAIHTEVGHHCTGARVDGRLQPLSHQLASGETIEVLTSKTGGPSRDWLDIVATPRARTKIKQWFTVQRREEALAEGKDYLTKSLRKASLPVQKMVADGSLEALATDMKYPSLEALYVAVGEGRISANTVVRRYVKLHQVEPEAEATTPAPVKLRAKPTSSVLVEGSGDIWTNLARCCMPVPLDPIVGFITRGRGVSVHRADCHNALALGESSGRMVPVKWNPRVTGSFSVEIQIESLDRPGLLRDVTAAVSDTGTNILNASMAVHAGHAVIRFTFEITAPSQLITIINMVNRVEGVYEARRVTPKPVPTP